MTKRKLRMGMVGGGRGAFIGAVHRMAARLDGEIEIVCGAFSSSAEKSKLTGDDIYLPSDRTYGSYNEMYEQEKSLPEDVRMDFVSIVTPNFLHFDPTVKALESGFPVVLDKPMTFDYVQALKLKEVVDKTGLLFALTHTYTGYPMVKQAKEMVRRGDIGTVRKIHVEYPQGWLSAKLEDSGQKQAEWRTDPKRSGMGGSIGDIGTHAANMAEYISGQKITHLCANVNIVVEGRLLDDDADILVRFENGASGTITSSQVLTGSENNINIDIFGDKGGLRWSHEDANSLWFRQAGQPVQVLRAGVDYTYLSPAALKHCRTPSGHPEGFIEAFANIYRDFAFTLRAKLSGEIPDPDYADFPGIEDGVRGMAFIETVVESGKSDRKWVEFKV